MQADNRTQEFFNSFGFMAGVLIGSAVIYAAMGPDVLFIFLVVVLIGQVLFNSQTIIRELRRLTA